MAFWNLGRVEGFAWRLANGSFFGEDFSKVDRGRGEEMSDSGCLLNRLADGLTEARIGIEKTSE